MVEDDDLETLSRRDVTWTPITGSDMILSWAVFPRDKPASTFPASAYSQKPNPYAFGKSKLSMQKIATWTNKLTFVFHRGGESVTTKNDGIT